MKPKIRGKYCNQFDLNQQVYQVTKINTKKDVVYLQLVENENFKSKVPLTSFFDKFWQY